MNQFDRLETIAQRLIEGIFSRLFHTQLHPADLARHLAVIVCETNDCNGRDDDCNHTSQGYFLSCF